MMTLTGASITTRRSATALLLAVGILGVAGCGGGSGGHKTSSGTAPASTVGSGTAGAGTSASQSPQTTKASAEETVRLFVQALHNGNEGAFCSLLSLSQRHGASVEKCSRGTGFKAISAFPTASSVKFGAHRTSATKAEYLITGPGGFKAAVVLIQEGGHWLVDKFVRG
jgi:hypothetical protein